MDLCVDVGHIKNVDRFYFDFKSSMSKCSNLLIAGGYEIGGY
jgi:hypothetical protein